MRVEGNAQVGRKMEGTSGRSDHEAKPGRFTGQHRRTAAHRSVLDDAAGLMRNAITSNGRDRSTTSAAIRRLLTLATALAAFPQDGYGQSPTTPYLRPMHVPTWAVVMDVGRSNSLSDMEFTALRISGENQRHRVVLGFAHFTTGPEAKTRTASNDDKPVGIEASVAFSLSDQQAPRLFLFTAVVGASTVTLNDHVNDQWLSSRRLDIPVALTLGLAGNVPRSFKPVPSFVRSFEPWVSLRLHTRRTSFAQGSLLDAVWRLGGGAAAGLWIRLGSGFGIQGTYDGLHIRDSRSPRSSWSHSYSIGAHYVILRKY